MHHFLSSKCYLHHFSSLYKALTKPPEGPKVVHFKIRGTKNRQQNLEGLKPNSSNFRGTKNIIYPNAKLSSYNSITLCYNWLILPTQKPVLCLYNSLLYLSCSHELHLYIISSSSAANFHILC